MSNSSDPRSGPPRSAAAAAADPAPIVPESPPVFQCSGCGHCCTMWQVFIDRARGEHLLRQPWVQERLTDHQVELEPLPDKGYYLPLKLDNTCVFLAEDQRCLIDVNEGPGAKPNDCRRFPFAAVPAAKPSRSDGCAPTPPLRYDVSAACQTVARQLLLAFGPIQPGAGETRAVADYVERTAELSAYGRRVPGFGPWIARYPWPFGWFRRLDVAGYERILQEIRQNYLVVEGDPVALLRQTRARMLGQPSLQHAASAGTSAKVHPPWPPWKHRLLLALVLRRPYGLYSLWQWLGQGQFSDPKLLGRSARVTVAQVEAVRWPVGVGEAHVRAFLFALVSRRIGLSYGSAWVTQLSITLAAWALVGWYARVFAVLNNEEEVSQADTVLAIRTVERYYTGHQPRFQGLFDWNPLYGWLAVWLL